MGKVQKEGNSLQALQSGTLTLLYFALTHGDRSEYGIMDHGLHLNIVMHKFILKIIYTLD